MTGLKKGESAMATWLGRVSVLAVLTVALGADGPKPDEAERAGLIGTWKLTTAEEAGEPIPPDRLKDQTLILEASRYVVKRGDEVEEAGTFSIGATGSPKTIDLKIKTGRDEGKTQPGVYQLDGDSLKLAFAKPGAKDRPKAFATSGDGAALFVMTLKRERR